MQKRYFVVSIIKKENGFDILKNDNYVGEIVLSENRFHCNNIYLKFDFSFSEEKDCRELFIKLFSILKRPMQVMIYSNNNKIKDMLTSGGFLLKRRCFETETKSDDYIGKIIKSDLSDSTAGEEIYCNFANIYYKYYLELHKKINPFSAEYDSFCSKLPEKVFYDENGNFAFVEENEIAYVFGENYTFPSFAEKLVSYIFEKYDTLFFESDDNDDYAMNLKSLFIKNDKPSYDTYVYYGIDNL